MARLESLFEEWVSQGLITEQQRSALAAYELAKPQRNWVLYGVAGIGVIALITGVISIIASNWEYFSENAQLAGYFLIQAALGAGLFYRRNSSGMVREILLTLFGLFFFAGIGLIGQIYHLESDGQSALRFWLALTLPITLFAHSHLMSHLWFAGFTAAVLLWVLDVKAGVQESGAIAAYFRIMSAYGIAFGVVAIGMVRTGFLNRFFSRTALTWGLAATVLVGGSIGGLHQMALLGAKSEVPLPAWPWVGVIAAIASIWLFVPKGESKGWRIAMSLLLFLSAVALTAPLPTEASVVRQITNLILFVATWSSAAAAAAFAGRQRLFNFCTFLIAARFVVGYFEVFGSLAATGIGLIVSGGVILGAVWLWARSRLKLLRLLGVA